MNALQRSCFVISIACIGVLGASGCANEVLQKMNYTGADAACIETPYRMLNNPVDDIGQAYLTKVDGRYTGKDFNGPPKAICLQPGMHAIDVLVSKGYDSANLNLDMNFLSGKKYFLSVTVVNRVAKGQVFLVEGDTKSLVLELETRTDVASPGVYVPVVTPKR